MKKTTVTQPPGFARKLLRWFCREELIEDVEGDLAELFAQRLEKGVLSARTSYCLDVLLLFRLGIIKNIELNKGLIHTTMIKNYFKIAYRNALRYKGFTALNLLGLTVGLFTSTLIFLWVYDEVSVDKFHAEGDGIYQLFRNMRQSGSEVRTTWTIPKPAADLMRSSFSEVDEVLQVSWPVRLMFKNEETKSQENGFYVTPNFLTLMSFEWLTGDKGTALDDLGSIVISRSIAEKYFGSGWREVAIGSTIELEGDRAAIVTGVMENVGNNSSLQFDWLLPADYFFNQNKWVDDWGNGSFRIYFTLNNQESLTAVADRIKGSIKEYAAGQDNAGDEELIVHRFQDYYLYSNFTNGEVDGGRITYVRILTIVGMLILAIACINFMNLSTARSSRRSKEVGLRKVIGAYKTSIAGQFLTEAVLFTFLAMVAALILVYLVLPSFNLLVSKQLRIDFTNPVTWGYTVGLILFVGMLSGSYPAFILPRFRTIDALKGIVKQSSGTALIRRSLVVFQFAISTFLIIGISVVYRQLDYALNKDLGLNKENLLIIPLDRNIASRWETFKAEMLALSDVTALSVTSGNPIEYGRSTSSARWEGMEANTEYEINIMLADKDFVETTEIEIVDGRDFSNDLVDSTSFLINEAAASLMGFNNPIGKKLSFWGIDGKVIGVVKNYHMQDLYEPFSPLIISCISPERSNAVVMRVKGNPGQVLRETEKLLASMSPDYQFEYVFADQAYEENYHTEVMVASLMRVFAGISIFLSCLGLFGLSSFTAEQRSKEIGIRKVHGASVQSLVLLLSKDYSRLIVIAFLLAIPFGYYYTNQWLNSFEFRTTIQPLLFLVAGVMVFTIGVLTVSFKSFQAATINPSDTLKNE